MQSHDVASKLILRRINVLSPRGRSCPALWSPGPSCSKLTMSLVNGIVKTLIINYGIYANIFAEKNVSRFCICKSYSHFFSKNTCELNILLTRTVNILTTNELVKLTMLWTTGPWLGKRWGGRVLWLVVCVLSFTVCLLFLLVSLVGYVLWLWLCLDIFYTVILKALLISIYLCLMENKKLS